MNEQPSMNEMMEQLMAGLAQQMEEAERSDIDYKDMKMGIDESLVVTLETVPGDAFEESHSHVFPEEDTVILHLSPPESQDLDRKLTEFTEERL